MSEQSNPYPLRIDPTIMKKIKFISKENGRSINKEIEVILKNIVNEFEKLNGIIEIDINS